MTKSVQYMSPPFKYKSRTNNVGTKPKQRVAESSKTKDWADATADYYRGVCVPAVDRARAQKNYRLANGYLDESEYLYVTNPTNTKETNLQGAPARLMNWDIISPNIMLLMGEKARRQFPPTVYARNSVHDNLKQEEETRILVRELQKRFVNEARGLGIPFDEEQINMKLEDIGKSIKNIPDMMASQGQDILEYIMDVCEVPRQFRKSFYEYLCQSCTFSYKDVHKGEMIYETVQGIDVSYLCTRNHDFIHDGEAAMVTRKMSVNEIYDRFQDEEGFDTELKAYLDSTSGDDQGSFSGDYSPALSDIINPQQGLFNNLFGSGIFRRQADGGFTVQHIMWRSQIEIGILTYQGPDGNVIQEEVDRSFKALPTDIIKWEWRDQIWEDYCIDDDYWIGARPVPTQQGKKAKLLINGRNLLGNHVKAKSLPEKGEAYQKGVNIIKYRAEVTLAKNLDHIITMPLGLMPTGPGWSEDKFFYYLRSFSMLFFDDSKPNAAALVGALKNINVSALRDVVDAHSLVSIIKQEWDEACGINPQRKGQVAASAGSQVTQNAQDRSYVMSEEIFLEHDEFEREEEEALLELSKYAYHDGLQASFVRQDGTTAYLSIHDPSSFLYSDLGVFVKNTSRELNNLELAKQQAQAFAQNEMDGQAVVKLIEAGDFSKVHKVMDDFAERSAQRAQQAAELEANKSAASERIAADQVALAHYKTDQDNMTKLQVAQIQAGVQMASAMQQMEQAGQAATPEYNKLREDFGANSLAVLQNATKLKEIDAKLAMNKRDNETKLKNPTAGEK